MAPAGWNTGDQIRSHKLAASIINGHGTEDDVFDDNCLAQLQRFCVDPTIATRDKLSQEYDWEDGTEQAPGQKAADKGDLVGVLVARHGTENPAFDERDLEMLKSWFEEGMPKGQKVVR